MHCLFFCKEFRYIGIFFEIITLFWKKNGSWPPTDQRTEEKRSSLTLNFSSARGAEGLKMLEEELSSIDNLDNTDVSDTPSIYNMDETASSWKPPTVFLETRRGQDTLLRISEKFDA